MSMHVCRDWRTRSSIYEPEAFDITEPGHGAIAIVKSEQHAVLIAAAPDLLEALKEMLDMPEADGTFSMGKLRKTIKDQARAAIKKATIKESTTNVISQ